MPTSVCDLMLSEHDLDLAVGTVCNDPHHAAALARRRTAKAGAWMEIAHRTDGGGMRDFLDGKPIHCGEALELQAIEYKADDYGEYAVAVQRGAIVRYEVCHPAKERRDWSRASGPMVAIPDDEWRRLRVILHAGVAGHGFTAGLESWMRFRWPRDGR